MEDLKGDADIERKRKALTVRFNMLACRLACCIKEIKITLSKAFCLSLYTCDLWVRYTLDHTNIQTTKRQKKRKSINLIILTSGLWHRLSGILHHFIASFLLPNSNTSILIRCGLKGMQPLKYWDKRQIILYPRVSNASQSQSV